MENSMFCAVKFAKAFLLSSISMIIKFHQKNITGCRKMLSEKKNPNYLNFFLSSAELQKLVSDSFRSYVTNISNIIYLTKTTVISFDFSCDKKLKKKEKKKQKQKRKKP